MAIAEYKVKCLTPPPKKGVARNDDISSSTPFDLEKVKILQFCQPLTTKSIKIKPKPA